jgi:predicted MPP superfamily phosphohydrolase
VPLLALHGAVSLVLGGLVLFGPWPAKRGLTLPRMLTVVALLGLLLAAELLVLYLRHTGLFLWIALAHASLFVVLPLLALGVLGLGLRREADARPSRSALGLSLLTLVLPGVGAHAAWVEPFDLRIERVAVDVAAALPRPLKLAVLADYQLRAVGAYEVEAMDRLLALEPDLVLIPGDLLQTVTLAEYAEQGPALRDQLARLDAPGGAWFAQGNVDPYPAYHALFEGTTVRALDDELVVVELDGVRLAIGGLRLSGWRSDAGRATMTALAEADADVRILVSHLPRAVQALPASSGVDLVVSGHTHGGQVVLPLLGPPVTLSTVPRRVAAGGLHELNGNPIYVSRGVGMERGPAPPVRFNCPPELTLLTLH